MKIQQIRNATLKINYAGVTLLIDPWLQDKGTGFSARTVREDMAGVKNPLDDLPMGCDEILQGVDYCLLTHFHPDHFTADYLPKGIAILVANEKDRDRVEALGFGNATLLSEEITAFGPLTIRKTPCVHGDSLQLAQLMGEVSGYLLSGEEKQLYIAGDTVFFEGVSEILHTYKPEVIALNCCEATMPMGRLIMNLADIASVCEICKNSRVIATHLDSVNHSLIFREDVRKFIAEKGLNQVVVPENGDVITF